MKRAGKGKGKVNVRGPVWAYEWCYLLVKQMCFICQETGDCFYQSLSSQVKPHYFTYKTLTASLPFLRLNLKVGFHAHISCEACRWNRDSPIWHTSRPLWLFWHSLPAGSCWLQLKAERDTLSDARLEICHFKAWVKRPLRLLIGLSSSITPVLCIAPFVRDATVTNTLNLSSFDPP